MKELVHLIAKSESRALSGLASYALPYNVCGNCIKGGGREARIQGSMVQRG